MAIERTYYLEVIAKWEGTHGFRSITLRAPQDGQGEFDPGRPWWFDRTTTGAPITVSVSSEEMAEVEVGTLFTVSLQKVYG